ncbi:MAG: hypothetical protein GY746_17210 [Gammaproteobacteria bacterium]|uniref:hypothetical protein n=1 Tax=Oceanicoccus sp. TaxID=2691044 RepID=UPI0026080399|nr:hypothetical protein [Oceanicoccus sp.]MCP3907922.1 hypothetical protein [Oceanicoccus sp.]MCP4091506.1 hypothetical protein [Gammaproteobacteria bacterium]MCP4275416.1 hypothetical protein [Gammaproteobacteria bacterium]MCP4832304.1 hypothetical protein [Gammaproteobacteria bacterium]
MKKLILLMMFVFPIAGNAATILIDFDNPQAANFFQHPSGYVTFESQGYGFFGMALGDGFNGDGDNEALGWGVELIGGPPIRGEVSRLLRQVHSVSLTSAA